MDNTLCKTWLLSWDQTGLETIVLVYDPQWLLESLATGQLPRPEVNVRNVILRAQANQQRHYEVYAINFDYDMTEGDILEFYKQSPQNFVDLVRDRGHVMHSDRQKFDELVIR